jgi:desulfoferrodoxin (superoxide reductase-like protein)
MLKRTVTAIAFMLVFCFSTRATPPTDIIITFDTAKSIVKADIEHPTENPKQHFIYNIEVSVNGKKLIKQEATEQLNTDIQKVMYLIPGLKPGDKVSIYAECNQYGDLTKEAVVPQIPAKDQTKKK